MFPQLISDRDPFTDQESKGFILEGLKTHLLQNKADILVTEQGTDLIYLLDYFKIKKIWEKILDEDSLDKALTKLCSRGQVKINYTTRNLYIEKSEVGYNSHKIIYENFNAANKQERRVS